VGGDGFGMEDRQVQAEPVQRSRLGYVLLFSLSIPCLQCVASATTLQDVRLELAKDDAASSAQGVVSPHRVTLTTFLMTGLDLEEQQYVVHRPFPPAAPDTSLDVNFYRRSRG
jgi:hypothetical protein